MPLTDTALLLRVYAEHHWLQAELVPVLEQLESPIGVGADEHEAALAYLEVMWAEAQRRAHETDIAHAQAELDFSFSNAALVGQARMYYRWVRGLTAGLAERVQALVGPAGAAAHKRRWAA